MAAYIFAAACYCINRSLSLLYWDS